MSFLPENNRSYSTGMIGGWHETLANDAMIERAWKKEFEPSLFNKLLSKLGDSLKARWQKHKKNTTADD